MSDQYYEVLGDFFAKENVKALCEYFFDVTLTPSQEEIVKSIAFAHSKRTIISCMTRYGKSYCVSMAILLWILRNPNKKVAIIAPTNEKTTIIRNYMAFFIARSHVFSSMLDMERTGIAKIQKEVSKKRMTWKNGVELRTLSAEGQGSQLMGFGAHLIIVDEECDIDYEVYRSKITRMLGEGPEAAYVGIGNPHHRDNQMWQHWIDPGWTQIHIGWQTAIKEGRVTQEFIDEQREQLTSREFEVLYEANFPETSEDALIDYVWIERAYKDTRVYKKTLWVEPGQEDLEVIAGVDVAELGNDLTVVTIVHKNKRLNTYKVVYIASWGKVDLMPTVSKILPLLREYGVQKVIVDATGVGSGVYSRLEEIKREGKIKIRVEAFKGGMSPTTNENKERFMNIKAESYWHLRKLFEESKISILPYPTLVSQLNKMKWELTSSEKIRIRDPGTKQGDTAEQKSPDFSDSLNIACWHGGRKGLYFANFEVLGSGSPKNSPLGKV